jgi:hypothetical protein
MALFRLSKVLLFSSLLLALAVSASAQNPAPTPQVIAPAAKQPLQVAGQTKLFCAGYVRRERLPKMPEIIGAVEEQEQRMFADGDIVYINAGSRQGIEQGSSYQIIRPRGDLKGVHHQKRGFLGTFIQEVGQLHVFKVGENASAAQIILRRHGFAWRSADSDSTSRVAVATRRGKHGSLRGSHWQTGRTPDDG